WRPHYLPFSAPPGAVGRQSGHRILWGIDPLYSLSGFAVGAIVGLTGVGGGSLMTPLLILLFGIHPATAVGTDLLYAALTKSAGTLVNGLGNNVACRVAGRLGIGGVAAATATLWWLSTAGGQSPEVGHLVGVLLGGMLVLTALSLLLRRWLFRFASGRGELP